MTSSLVLAFVLSFAPLNLAQAFIAPAKANEAQIVHFSIINMSGRVREVHVRGSVISLPVAKAIVLRVPVGECIRVRSSTDSKFSAEIVISTGDEGRLFPVG